MSRTKSGNVVALGVSPEARRRLAARRAASRFERRPALHRRELALAAAVPGGGAKRERRLAVERIAWAAAGLADDPPSAAERTAARRRLAADAEAEARVRAAQAVQRGPKAVTLRAASEAEREALERAWERAGRPTGVAIRLEAAPRPRGRWWSLREIERRWAEARLAAIADALRAKEGRSRAG